MLRCKTCGHRTPAEYVELADECAWCGSTPFPEAIELGEPDPDAFAAGQLAQALDRWPPGARVQVHRRGLRPAYVVGIAATPHGYACLNWSAVGQLTVAELLAELAVMRENTMLRLAGGSYIVLVDATADGDAVLITSQRHS